MNTYALPQAKQTVRQGSFFCWAPGAWAVHGRGGTPRWRCHCLRCEGLPLEPGCGPPQTRGSSLSWLLGCGECRATSGYWAPAVCTGRSRKAGTGEEQARLSGWKQATWGQHRLLVKATQRREQEGEGKTVSKWLSKCSGLRSTITEQEGRTCSLQLQRPGRQTLQSPLRAREPCLEQRKRDVWAPRLRPAHKVKHVSRGLWFYISTSFKCSSVFKTHDTNKSLKCNTTKYTLKKGWEVDLGHLWKNSNLYFQLFSLRSVSPLPFDHKLLQGGSVLNSSCSQHLTLKTFTM